MLILKIFDNAHFTCLADWYFSFSPQSLPHLLISNRKIPSKLEGELTSKGGDLYLAAKSLWLI